MDNMKRAMRTGGHAIGGYSERFPKRGKAEQLKRAARAALKRELFGRTP